MKRWGGGEYLSVGVEEAGSQGGVEGEAVDGRHHAVLVDDRQVLVLLADQRVAVHRCAWRETKAWSLLCECPTNTTLLLLFIGDRPIVVPALSRMRRTLAM